MYRFFPVSVGMLFLGSVLVWGQGIRMPPDLLPLEVGNVWSYEMTDASGNVVNVFQVEVTDYGIVEATSWYVFSRFPLAPEGAFESEVAIRYDSQRREYVYFAGDRDNELFPAVGATAEVLDSDSAGQPLTIRVFFDEASLTFERGLGITEAVLVRPEGEFVARLVGADASGVRIGNAIPTEPESLVPVNEPITNVARATDANPILDVEVQPDPDGHRFVFHVGNTSDRLLAFEFSSSQDYDFVVTNRATGQEVWRWSQHLFFSQVLRSESVRANGEWTFVEVWDHRDNDLNPVPSGTYQVQAVLTSTPPMDSEPIVFEVP